MSKDEYLITDAPLKALTVFAMPTGQLRVPRLMRYSTCIFPELRSICHFFQMSFAMSMGGFLF